MSFDDYSERCFCESSLLMGFNGDWDVWTNSGVRQLKWLQHVFTWISNTAFMTMRHSVKKVVSEYMWNNRYRGYQKKFGTRCRGQVGRQSQLDCGLMAHMQIRGRSKWLPHHLNALYRPVSSCVDNYNMTLHVFINTCVSVTFDFIESASHN